MAGKTTKNINAFILTPNNTDNIPQESIQDAHNAKIIEEVYSTENIEVKTDLNELQIKAITKGQLFAEHYNCSIMGKLCNKIMVLSISKNRLGRKEFKEISQNIQNPPEPDPITMRERLLGK